METGEFHPAILPVFDTADRSAIMILPREIYHQWLNCVCEKKDYVDFPEPEVFLFPGFKTLDQAESFIRNFYDLFFQYELRKWNLNPQLWPENRTYELFREWFDIRVSTTVSDMLAQPVFKKSCNFPFDNHEIILHFI